MQDIKYNQGFSDALACTTNVLETMLKEVEGVIKRKKYHAIVPVISHSIISISNIWNEINKRNIEYIEKLANKYEIVYNSNTHHLEVDEETQEIKVERSDN